MCDATLLGWLLISPEHLSFCCQLRIWGAVLHLAITLWPIGPTNVGQTISSGLRESHPSSLVMKVVPLMFTSQVRVSLKKRSFAGVCVCVCVCAHGSCSSVIFPLEKAIEKPTCPYKVGDTIWAEGTADSLLLWLHNSWCISPDEVTALKWILSFSERGALWGWTQHHWILFAFQVGLSSLWELKIHRHTALLQFLI